jgi:hypothetical protein
MLRFWWQWRSAMLEDTLVDAMISEEEIVMELD